MMWYALLEAGSLWFWIVVLLVGIVETVLVETLEFGWTFVGFGLFVALIELFTTVPADVAPGTWIKLNVGKFVACLACYLIVGTVWSFLRWWWFLRKAAWKYMDQRVVWLRAFGGELSNATRQTKVPPDQREHWREASRTLRAQMPKSPRDYWDRITLWVLAWPLSFIGTVIRDPVRMTGQWFQDAFAGVYHAMAKSWLDIARVEEDIAPPPATWPPKDKPPPAA